MRVRSGATAALAVLLWTGAGAQEAGRIRLNIPAPAPSASDEDASPGEPPTASAPAPLSSVPASERRAFDREAFDARLETLWFARKAALARDARGEADRHAEELKAFLQEEGVQRLEKLAGALVAEAAAEVREGAWDEALAALDLAESVDPGSPQIRLARASALWRSGRGAFAAAGQLAQAVKSSVVRGWKDLSLVHDLALVAVLAALGAGAVFSVLMLVRYQAALRHDVEEWMARSGREGAAPAAGWAVLLLPLVTWVGAGWAAAWWILASFRYMRRRERAAGVVLLVLAAATVPAYRMAVALYGVLADPAVRTTLEAAGGEYDPDRILRMQELVASHPEEPEYRFLLANLYKNGRFFQEAFQEYRNALDLDPTLYPATVNLGNLFYQAGRYADAVSAYKKAIELRPGDVLAYYDMHLAQNEAFHFREAEETLRRARTLNVDGIADLLAHAGREGNRPVVVDAAIGTAPVWAAAIEGRPLREGLQGGGGSPAQAALRQVLNPVSIVLLLLAAAAPLSLFALAGRPPARRCIRCGRPFCTFCKSAREGTEYCSQCAHLFLIGDGLAPQTKTRKLYEVERHERATRRGRRIASLALPGAAHLLRGRTGAGLLLVAVWLAALIAWKPILLAPVARLAGSDLRLDLLQGGGVPTTFHLDPSGVLALAAAVLAWVLGNLWGRAREA